MSIEAKFGKRLLSGREIKKIAGVEEHVGDICEWPFYVKDHFLKDKWHHDARFSICCFMLGNGVNPNMLTEYAISERKFRFQSSAQNFAAILRDHQEGKLSSVAYWNLQHSPDQRRCNPEGVCYPDCAFRKNPDYTCGRTPYAHWCFPMPVVNFAKENETTCIRGAPATADGEPTLPPLPTTRSVPNTMYQPYTKSDFVSDTRAVHDQLLSLHTQAMSMMSDHDERTHAVSEHISGASSSVFYLPPGEDYWAEAIRKLNIHKLGLPRK